MSDIARLFATDPLNHTDQDIDRIIEHFRSARGAFTVTGKAPPKLAKKEAEIAKEGLPDVDIGGL